LSRKKALIKEYRFTIQNNFQPGPLPLLSKSPSWQAEAMDGTEINRRIRIVL